MSPEEVANKIFVELEYVGDLFVTDYTCEENVIIILLENGERFSVTIEELL